MTARHYILSYAELALYNFSRSTEGRLVGWLTRDKLCCGRERSSARVGVKPRSIDDFRSPLSQKKGLAVSFFPQKALMPFFFFFYPSYSIASVISTHVLFLRSQHVMHQGTCQACETRLYLVNYSKKPSYRRRHPATPMCL